MDKVKSLLEQLQSYDVYSYGYDVSFSSVNDLVEELIAEIVNELISLLKSYNFGDLIIAVLREKLEEDD
jgi:hypothetical protein